MPSRSPAQMSSPRRSPKAAPPQGREKGPIEVRLEHLRPTQIGVGTRSVEAKRRKVRRRAKCRRKLTRFLEKRPIPAVRGPGKAFYIVDRHHLSVALLQNEVATAFVHVIDDLSYLAPRSFWLAMEKEGKLYPFDERGRRVEHVSFPRAISDLREDPYRDLAWSVRKRNGFKKCSKPFAEFAWADFFRTRIPRSILEKDYEKAVLRALRLAKSDLAAGLPGHVSS